MNPTPSPLPLRAWLACACAALALALAGWAAQAHWGYGSWDEGYLWYGAQRTRHGEVPIRDFMAYDVGRYVWSAWVVWLRGDEGVVTVRLAAALFQALGLAAGLACLWRAGTGAFVRIAGALLLLAWSWPGFRAFDCACATLLVAAAAAIVAAPTPRRCALAGLAVGLIAIVGRNHGAYGAVATLAALAVAAPRGERLRAACAWGAGIAVGYAPMLVLLGADAGFRAAFIADNLDLVHAGATNIALPVPWPHLAFGGGGARFEVLRRFVLGLGFVALPAFVAAGAWRAFRLGPDGRARHAVFVACVPVAAVYAHLVFSRADLSHLASGISPLLLGLLAWPEASARARAVVATLLLAATAVTVVPMHPGVAGRLAGNWEARTVAGDALRMPAPLAREFDFLAAQVAPGAPGSDRDVLVAPYGAGAYAAFGRRAPVWEIYALQARPPEFEQAEIARLQAAGVRRVLLQDIALDGRDELRYAATHPRLHAWVLANFVAVARAGDTTAYARRDAAP